MNERRSAFRRWSGWIGVPLLVLLAMTVWVTGSHHHEGAGSHDTCAICSIGHAPSTAAESGVIAAALPVEHERFAPAPPETISSTAPVSVSTRAPPASLPIV
jgi:hypothetical protein